jgi:hypothetical protein
MRRKSLWLSLGLLTLIAGVVLTTLVMLSQHEPSFYARCAVPPGPQRTELSKEFFAVSCQLVSSIKNGGHRETGDWGARFTDTQLNSYLEEHFLTDGMADKLLPEDVHEPRIAIEKDRLRLAFRYGRRPWSTIISIDFRVWLAKGEPNVVVLELQGLHAGALPISAQSLLEEISEGLRRHNIQVSWYRHQGNPTAALTFQTDQPRPTAQLRQLDLQPGMVTLVGHSSEPLPRPTGLAPRGD